MINSIQKGKRGEREFAAFLREYGYMGARRGQQHSGIEGKDVVGIPGFHIEVKRNEKVKLSHPNPKYPGAIQQAHRDAAPGEIPVVAHRKNGDTQWLITMKAEVFLNLIKE